ncbi:beta-lactamase family protein [Halomonas sp. LR3S48]|uniref:serine hydrolase domain-containing protein n=1 Tax=Halomonas sp. LR3S48 TaxID=2982694 RepID=UPI0021E4F985|nr:serine hydrolase [Halomonas sp. LR3S48]UYG03375.1 beta-lactamase family protein [Halomonas sp. LR3S48]
MRSAYKNNVIALAALATLYSTVALASPSQAPDSEWTTETLVSSRANMFHPALNHLTFQSLDKMFSTKAVEASSAPWGLEKSPMEIDETFTLEGEDVSLEAFLEGTRTNALLVLKDGKIAYERYRNGLDEATPHAVFSVSKSILATLIGFAVEDGSIASLDDKVVDYVPALAGSGYEDVSILEVLRMRSGVAWEEVYEFGGSTQLTEVHDNALVAYRYRWCDYAASSSERQYEPGERFNYSTLDTSVLGCVLEGAVGTTVANYMTEKLWQPAGMEFDAYWIMDGPEPVGNEFYGAGFNATLRDLGRFGLMMLDMGEANGVQVLSRDWVESATVSDPGYERISEDASIGYQYQWWTFPEREAYSAIGIYNQFVYIDPLSRTVIVKLSHTPDAQGWEDDTLAFFEKISHLTP